MSLKCPSSPVYHTSAMQKRHARDVAKNYRYGTPKIRDLLREKCRIRMKEARQSVLDESRGVKSSLKLPSDINEILRQELAELEQDITLQDQIYNELLDEFNEWYAAELEHEESYLIEMESDNPEELLCPICMQQPLTRATSTNYKCACAISFCYDGDVSALRNALHVKVNLHELRCEQALRFFVEPQETGLERLSAICDSCDYFCNF